MYIYVRYIQQSGFKIFTYNTYLLEYGLHFAQSRAYYGNMPSRTMEQFLIFTLYLNRI